MTDKQQPPERIWIDGEAHRIMGQGSYFAEPYDSKSVEYARVHQTDDARVEEIRERWSNIPTMDVGIWEDGDSLYERTGATSHCRLSPQAG